MPDAVSLVADEDATDTAIEFGHHQLHGEVFCRQPLAIGSP
jgi:hypothetical protein